MPEANQIVTGIAVYFILWWLVLYAVLPWGIKSQLEDKNVFKGSERGAPVNPRLKRKATQTSVIAAIIWLIAFFVLKFDMISLDDFPFIPDFVPDDV